MENNLKQKELHIEFLRVFAAFWIIFNHTNTNGSILFYEYPADSVRYWIYGMISVFCTFAVPFFLAISGALLLPKEESIKEVYRKRVLRIFIVLVLISLVYDVYNYRADLSVLSVKQFLYLLYSYDHHYHLWYLYTFLAFLMLLPFLRKMVKGMENVHFLYIAGIAVVFKEIVPILEWALSNDYWKLNPKFNISGFVCNIILFPCIGYYIENRMDIKRVKGQHIALLWIVNVITIIVSCILVEKTSAMSELYDGRFRSTFDMINMITVYITGKYVFDRHSASVGLSRIIESFGDCTFGIYLIHVLVMWVVSKLGVFEFFIATLGFNDMLSVLLYCFVVLLVSYGITFVVKKIPFMNKLI